MGLSAEAIISIGATVPIWYRSLNQLFLGQSSVSCNLHLPTTSRQRDPAMEDSPWDDNPHDTTPRDVEWSRISSEFTNVGYREGIIAGKEAASQEGFDFGFATVGVPIGRELGLLRGITSVLLAFLKNAPTTSENERMLAEAQDISTQLSNVRFSDIMPRDSEAEEHAREHLEAEGMELDTHEDISAKRDVEGIEDMLANMSAGNDKTKNQISRPTADDVQNLKIRLGVLSDQLGLNIECT